MSYEEVKKFINNSGTSTRRNILLHSLSISSFFKDSTAEKFYNLVKKKRGFNITEEEKEICSKLFYLEDFNYEYVLTSLINSFDNWDSYGTDSLLIRDFFQMVIAHDIDLSTRFPLKDRINSLKEFV